MAANRTKVQAALDGIRLPARRRALVAHALGRRADAETVNTVHLLSDKEYRSSGEIDEAVNQLHENERNVWRILDSPRPPHSPIGETTDYEQIAIAWGKRHHLDVGELMRRLEATPSSSARAFAVAIRNERRKREAVERALTHPLSGPEPQAPAED